MTEDSRSTIPVSVIMPVFNSEGYLAEAIQSVLGQIHTGLELVVVDDYSTDRSWYIVADGDVQIERHSEYLTRFQFPTHRGEACTGVDDELERPGVTASRLVTFPGLLSGEGVNAGFRVDGLTTLDYIIRPRRPILSFLLSHIIVSFFTFWTILSSNGQQPSDRIRRSRPGESLPCS